MKADYLKFVQWSEPDQLFVGYCPDLFIGGVCHGSDEQMSIANFPASSPKRSPKASAPNIRCRFY